MSRETRLRDALSRALAYARDMRHEVTSATLTGDQGHDAQVLAAIAEHAERTLEAVDGALRVIEAGRP